MNNKFVNSVVLLAAGFAGGVVATSMAAVPAGTPGSAVDLTARRFVVSIDEIKQNFVFAQAFTGRYARTVTLSDGSVRDIELIPVIADGRLLVRFNDSGGHSFMGPNGTTTNGKLMVQLRDLDQLALALAADAGRH